MVLAATAGMPWAGAPSADGFTYDLVTVGDADNPAGFYGYGAVDYGFQIGVREVTVGQYAAFLNAVAATDPYSLYHPGMGSDSNIAGIARSGSDGAYGYSAIANSGDSSNRPITYVNWFDAARFANWMANGQPTNFGTQEEIAAVINDGAYTLHGAVSGVAPLRNAINPRTGQAPAFFIPNENEWYKAAFFNPNRGGAGSPGYFTFATQSDVIPGNVPGNTPNQVNYIVRPSGNYSFTQDSALEPTQNYLTDGEAFTASGSFYGTFDQNGNVWEVLDSAYGSTRALMIVRGGGWTSYDNYLWEGYRLSSSSSAATSNGGFRLAAPTASSTSAFVEVPATSSPATPALTLATSPSAGVIDYPLVTVGDAGNAANPATGLGAVAADFRIGTYDVTIGQYTDFLNIVAKSDPYSLYNPNMATDLNVAGIQRTGTDGAFVYAVMDNAGSSVNRPITYVSWFDAARFANWMANGQPVDLATGEAVAAAINDGAYDLTTSPAGIAPRRNDVNPYTGEAPAFALPTQDQWYKAAYFSTERGGEGVPGYFTFATQSDAIPGNLSGTAENQMNVYTGVFSFTQSDVYASSQNYLTDVGAFSGSEGFYGTFDMNGNVYQWNDLDGPANASRGVIGGFWFGGPVSASSTTVAGQAATYEGSDVGFRLVAPVPEPGAATLMLAGLPLVIAAARRGRPRRVVAAGVPSTSSMSPSARSRAGDGR